MPIIYYIDRNSWQTLWY